jgi:hypothetical protein
MNGGAPDNAQYEEVEVEKASGPHVPTPLFDAIEIPGLRPGDKPLRRKRPNHVRRPAQTR